MQTTQPPNMDNGRLYVTNEQMRELEEILANATTLSREAMSRLMDPRRNYRDECGYPLSIPSTEYLDFYCRDPIGATVVGIYPRECWQVQPSVYESEDPDEVTAFEARWDEVVQNLRGPSWYKGEYGSPMWEYQCRADELSGIGQYGVEVLGIDDGRSLEEPADMLDFRKPRKMKQRELTSIRVYPESMAEIASYEQDRNNPRYGFPTMYNITEIDLRNTPAGAAPVGTTRHVHWSRVIHLADSYHKAPLNEIFASPRMEICFEDLLDLRWKLYGGSAEMYWRGALPGWSLETHPQLGGDVKINKQSIRDQMELLMNGLQRYAAWSGMSMKSLAPQVVDPSPQIKTRLERICIKIRVPMRIFMGSERGELASSQDERQWAEQRRDRQVKYQTPKIVSPVADRLIMLGVLPVPESGAYYCWWPDIAKQSDAEKADVGGKRTQAFAAYTQGGVETLITPIDFLTKIMGIEDEEAQAIIENAAAQMEDEDGTESGGSPLLGLVGGITGMIELFKLAQSGGLSEEQLAQQIMLFFKVSRERADAIIADGLTPAAEQAGEVKEEPEKPPIPIKVKEGEELIDPREITGNLFVVNEEDGERFITVNGLVSVLTAGFRTLGI